MRVDALATLPHYADHLAPVWEALPESARGTWWGPFGRRIDRGFFGDDRTPLLVAGAIDGQRHRARPLILVEHGAGQTYAGDPASATSPSYSGGDEWDRAVAFLCPSERVAARWRARYPHADAVAVGCPKLDTRLGSSPLRGPRPVVALTFHWDCPLIPETRSAWGHYAPSMRSILAELDAAGFSVVGHSHPRWRGTLAHRWADLGVHHLASFDAVVDTASVLVADNTSVLYEFAAIGRPVVVLNAPWYRRDVDHGLRFWSHVPGPQCDHPADVAPAVAAAFSDGHRVRAERERAVAEAYTYTDGSATLRAVEAITAAVARLA